MVFALAATTCRLRIRGDVSVLDDFELSSRIFLVALYDVWAATMTTTSTPAAATTATTVAAAAAATTAQ